MISPKYQTSSLEAFHSLIIRYAPKHTHFGWLSMLARYVVFKWCRGKTYMYIGPLPDIIFCFISQRFWQLDTCANPRFHGQCFIFNCLRNFNMAIARFYILLYISMIIGIKHFISCAIPPFSWSMLHFQLFLEF